MLADLQIHLEFSGDSQTSLDAIHRITLRKGLKTSTVRTFDPGLNRDLCFAFSCLHVYFKLIEETQMFYRTKLGLCDGWELSFIH